MSVCAYMLVCVCVYLFLCIWMDVCEYMDISVSVCVCVCVYTPINIGACVYLAPVSVCIYVHLIDSSQNAKFH